MLLFLCVFTPPQVKRVFLTGKSGPPVRLLPPEGAGWREHPTPAEPGPRLEAQAPTCSPAAAAFVLRASQRTVSTAAKQCNSMAFGRLRGRAHGTSMFHLYSRSKNH